MEASNRDQDMRAETELAVFMDRNFYSRLHDGNGDRVHFERKRDKESQLEGIDVLLTAGGREFAIDEKATLYYSNAMIPTFAFEIDSIQEGQVPPVEGWFVNDRLKTTHYMLIWPNVKCEKQGGRWFRKDIKRVKDTDFTIVEAVLMEKKVLRDELLRYGLDRSRLLAEAEKIRDKREEDTKGMIERKIGKEIKITFSTHIAERPVNIVIHKSILMRLAKAVYLISEDGYAAIK